MRLKKNVENYLHYPLHDLGMRLPIPLAVEVVLSLNSNIISHENIIQRK